MSALLDRIRGMQTEVVTRIVDGKAEVAVPGAWLALCEHAKTLKGAYRERLATGKYDAVKERRDLRVAFVDFAMELGFRQKDALRAYRRLI